MIDEQRNRSSAQRLGLLAEAFAAIAAVALAVAIVMSAAPGSVALCVAIAVAVCWGSASVVVDLLAAGADHDDQARPGRASDATGSVTVVVRLGTEPDEIALATIGLARSVGPVHVLATAASSTAALNTLSGLDGVTVHHSGVDGASVQTIARSADTDGVLITSARAMPLQDTCRQAAGRLDAATAWVVGRSRPFNPDRYGSDRREVTGAALRHRCGAVGLLTWETDATMVRRDLLAEHPLEPHRPLGQWLRQRAGEGHRGVRTEDELSLRAAPVASQSYWPDTVARQRATVADLSGALAHGSVRARLCAAGLIARELYAWPLLLWLLMPVLLVGGAPVAGAGALIAALVAVVALRWFALGASLDVARSARADLAAAASHAPGSLASSAAVLTRRIHRPRWAMPTRPLVWAGLAGTLVAGYGLVGNTPGSSSSRVAAVASLLLLGLLWALTIRSLVEKNWERSSFRVRLDLPARIGATSGRVIDGSPGGLAFEGALGGEVGVGQELRVEVGLDEPAARSGRSGPREPDRWVTMQAVVASHRRRSGRELWGLELHTTGEHAGAWAAQLLGSARRRMDASDRPGPAVVVAETRRSVRTVVDRVVLALVVAISVAVLAALALVLLGFTPLVIRSGSMEPTYDIGDIVLVEDVPAAELRVGEVASLDEYAPIGESMTHRIRAITPMGDQLEVETRGDANESSERWTVAAGEPVGVVRASIPAIGAPATLVRTSVPVLAIGVVLLAAVLTVVLGGNRRSTTTTQPDPPRTASRAP